MNARSVSIALVMAVLVLAAGSAAYTKLIATKSAAQQDLGTYEYSCDRGVAFSLTVSSDVQSVVIAPKQGQAFPPAGVLLRNSAIATPQFGGNGILITPHGETVALSEGNASVNCNPVTDSENAPFDFGE